MTPHDHAPAATPIHDNLAAEHLAAQLDDDDAVAEWVSGE